MLPDDVFDIPDSPKCSPISTEDVAPQTFSFSTQHEAHLDLFTIPDSPTTLPVGRTKGHIPESPNVPSGSIPAGQDSIQFPQTEVFDIPDLPPSPIDELMDLCDIPPSTILPADVHPEIPHTSLEAGPSMVDPQLHNENPAERRSLKMIRKNLIPYLPVILSRASLLRAQLAQLITERDFIKGQIDGAVTRIAEVDRYLYGLRALQLMRQEGLGDEEASM